MSQPLRELLSNKKAWLWGPQQDRAFQQIKEELTKPTTLIIYDPGAETKISADASSFGLGAVLLQQSEGLWKPIAYASRSMTQAERRYAQIEKEALAITWACQRFSDYVLGRRFTIESDHKPLIPLLNTKHLDALPPRVVRFRLRLAKFDYVVNHVPGKFLYTADALSRAPIPETGDSDLEEEVQAFVDGVTQYSLPASKGRLEEYMEAQKQDPILSQVCRYCESEWPDKKFIPPVLIPYYQARESLTVCNDLLLFNERIVVPKALRKETLQRVHSGHQGVEKCRARVAVSVWWPGVYRDVQTMVQSCQECAKLSLTKKEPLIPTPLPDYPWQLVGTDLFELNQKHYLLVVDYFSRYPEVLQLSSTTSASVITALKTIFARHGIPETLRSDNGPQYSSGEFAQFASSYGFNHVTSSPRYAQSNGQVERAVCTIKAMLKKSKDPYIAILSYRATPLPWCARSPAELCMGRKIRSTVPQTKSLLIPQWSYIPEFRKRNAEFKQKQKAQFDRRHRVFEQDVIPDGTDVWITSESDAIPGTVVSAGENPRSYIVETPTGQVQRNRSHLNVAPESSSETSEPSETQSSSNVSTPPKMIMTRSKTGTTVNPPDRLV